MSSRARILFYILWVRIPPESILFYFFLSSFSDFFLKAPTPLPLHYLSVFQLVSVPTSASALLSSLLTCLPRGAWAEESKTGSGRQKRRESGCERWDKGRALAPGRRRQWQPTPVLLPGKSHGRRSLVGCRLWGCRESDTTERLHFPFTVSCIGEGNGDPLQCSCLDNPRDGGAWWAAVYGVA